MNARRNAKIVCALMIVASMSSVSVNAQERSPSWQLTSLYTFLGQADGALPNEVSLDPANNLYGTTINGGSSNCAGGGCGVAFKIDTRGRETLLHTFTATGSDGYNPGAGLLRDSSGILYGTTYLGGANSNGVLFKLTPQPRACASVLCSWNETILRSFGASGDGANPVWALIQDKNSNVYGTTTSGGMSNCSPGCGTVYKVDSQGRETVLHDFAGAPTDGGYPFAPVLLDALGNLYGTTSGGGANNAGTVFQLTSAGSKNILYNFTGGGDGGTPFAGLVADQHGNLYGTTFNGGGSCNCGVVFELIPNQNGSWTESVLWTFTGGADGGWPFSGMIIDSQGNLYGTTTGGGLTGGCSAVGSGESGCGVVFELSPNGESVLWTFTGGSDGSYPYGPVVMDTQGNLYGAAIYGGDLNATNPACAPSGTPVGCGVVFKLAP